MKETKLEFKDMAIIEVHDTQEVQDDITHNEPMSEINDHDRINKKSLENTFGQNKESKLFTIFFATIQKKV